MRGALAMKDPTWLITVEGHNEGQGDWIELRHNTLPWQIAIQQVGERWIVVIVDRGQWTLVDAMTEKGTAIKVGKAVALALDYAEAL